MNVNKNKPVDSVNSNKIKIMEQIMDDFAINIRQLSPETQDHIDDIVQLARFTLEKDTKDEIHLSNQDIQEEILFLQNALSLEFKKNTVLKNYKEDFKKFYMTFSNALLSLNR
jgi:hypothetical protein